MFGKQLVCANSLLPGLLNLFFTQAITKPHKRATGCIQVGRQYPAIRIDMIESPEGLSWIIDQLITRDCNPASCADVKICHTFGDSPRARLRLTPTSPAHITTGVPGINPIALAGFGEIPPIISRHGYVSGSISRGISECGTRICRPFLGLEIKEHEYAGAVPINRTLSS